MDICELVGLFILHKLMLHVTPKEDIGPRWLTLASEEFRWSKSRQKTKGDNQSIK
jgi:hypothetical protein